jgi:beta-lactamase regulating signal transducer with metallopeptidase domain
VIDHLLFSTVVLGVSLAAARFLPLTARTRYAIVFCGLAKFALPAAAFRFLPDAALPPSPLRVFGGGTAAAAPDTRIEWLPVLWGAVALLLFMRWLLLRGRTVAAALRSPAPASQREMDAVAEARRAMRVRAAVDVVRSPICEAPAVVRIIRPVIVLPARGCDELMDDELRGVVLHECAHIARHDNLAAAVQALATSLLWFHPLVWLASRVLAAAREEASDERVAEVMGGSETYLDALAKVCRSLAAPPTAGVSCMAGSRINERMEHLMSYETIRTRAWPHRAALALAIIAVVAATAVTAGPVRQNHQQHLYSLAFDVTPGERGVTVAARITERSSGKVVATPSMTVSHGQPATASVEHGGYTIHLLAHTSGKTNAEVLMEVKKDSQSVQRDAYTYKSATYTGEPISMNLKDADLRDVLNTLGQLTGLRTDIAPDVEGSVTIDVAEAPWDEVLETLVAQNGLTATVEGKTITVRKR